MKKTTLIIFLIFFTNFLIGQSIVKIGYLDSEKIISLMPETKSAKKVFENKKESLQYELEMMQEEYNNKVDDYIYNAKTWSVQFKEKKELEIQKLQRTIHDFQINLENNIKALEKEFNDPINSRINKTIKDIAKKNGYSIIFNEESILYHSNDCDNLLNLVSNKMNIPTQYNSKNKYLAVRNPKFGYCNINELYTNMPEAESAQNKLRDKQTLLEKEFNSEAEKLQNLIKEYTANTENWSNSDSEKKYTELKNLQQQLLEFRENVVNSLLAYEKELMRPVEDKVLNIIKEVAFENQFSIITHGDYIFNIPNQLFNITKKCKKRLGISSSSAKKNNSPKTNFSYAYINSEDIMPKLPYYIHKKNEITELKTQKEIKLIFMMADFKSEMERYSSKSKSTSAKEQEQIGENLLNLKYDIQYEQEKLINTIQYKNLELQRNPLEIIRKRTNEISKEKNIDFVFLFSAVLFVDETFINLNKFYFNDKPILVESPIDKNKPTIKIIEPEINRGFKVVQKNSIDIIVEVKDKSGILEVYINNQKAPFIGNNIFHKTIYLGYGENIITVKAIDTKNNITIEEFKLERKSEVIVNNNIQNKKLINAGKYYALIIGNNVYSDAAISSLDEPINDAFKLYDVLTTKYNFEKTNVSFLKNATYVQMIEAFDDLSNKITPDDNLLVFYAGHGWWDEEKKLGYWLPTDAKKRSTAFWIANSRISDYMSSINSKHTLLIADACFSGSIFKTRNAFGDAQPAINKLYALTSKKAMTSGNLKEVPDKSVFLKYLVKRLAENTEKYISADQLFSSFRQAVLNNSPTEPQYGTIQNAGDEGGEFIFIKR